MFSGSTKFPLAILIAMFLCVVAAQYGRAQEEDDAFNARAFSIELEKPVKILADGEAIDVKKDNSYAGPKVRDHDGDGLPDLLVSAYAGNIRFFKNIGTPGKPKFTAAGELEAGGKPIRINNW